MDPGIIPDLKQPEEEVHLQAGRYMQLKQIEMSGQLQRDHSILAAKVNRIDAKARKMEERLAGQLPEYEENLDTCSHTSSGSQDTEHDADVLRDMDEKSEHENREDESTE